MIKIKYKKIDDFHESFVKQIEKEVKLKFTIKTLDNFKEWKKVLEGTEVEFHLMSSEQIVEQRTRRGKSLVSPLFPPIINEQALWFAWYEKWISCSNKEYLFIQASLTFFWGMPSYTKDQIFRTEWCDPSQLNGNAAQPHWHFDSPIRALNDFKDESRQSYKEDLIDLEELSTSKPESSIEELGSVLLNKEIDLSGIHLGSSGWNHDKKYPKKWQHEINDVKELRKWAICVLELSKSEFKGVKSF